MKVVINKCYGAFCLSNLALERIYSRSSHLINLSQDSKDFRSNPVVVQVVEEMGKASWGKEPDSQFTFSPKDSELRVVEIPNGIEWHIAQYDGLEWIAEDHRTWGND